MNLETYTSDLSPPHQSETEKYFSPRVREWGFPNAVNFCFWNARSLALESGIELKDSGILLTIGIRRPSSDDKESRIHGVESKAVLRACLHGSGGPQIGEVTCGGHPTYHVHVIKLK